MAIERSVYSTEDLLGVFRDLQPISAFWLSFFPGVYNSQTENIEWSKITDYRHLAPLVVPTAQGRPTFKAEEDLYSVRPGYLKPKDTIQAGGMLVRKAGLGELGQVNPLTPDQRYQASVAAVLQKHRNDIERRWEWMAAQALLNGKITLEDDGYPKATVDFMRAANHTITLGSLVYWHEGQGARILNNIESWVDRMASAVFGGAPDTMIVGTDVWAVMRITPQILKLLDMDVRNTSGTTLDLGVGNGDKVQYKGQLSRNLSLWVYSDFYQTPGGTNTTYMSSKDVLMLGPNVRGVKAFGAIQDVQARFMATPVFPKMWEENDPSGTVLMTQSAPLMVPINPNATLRARVLA